MRRALGLFLIKSLAVSRLGRQAPLRAAPRSDDSERGKYFYNPGVVSGIQSLGEKMQLLTTCLQSLGRDTHLLAFWIVRRDSVPQCFCSLCEYKTNSYVLWSVNAAQWPTGVFRQGQCAPWLLCVRGTRRSIIPPLCRLHSGKDSRKRLALPARLTPPPWGSERPEGAMVVWGAGVQDPSWGWGPLTGIVPWQQWLVGAASPLYQPGTAGRRMRMWKAGCCVSFGCVAESSCGQE